MLDIILTVNYCQLLLTVPSVPVYKRLKESEWELVRDTEPLLATLQYTKR